MTNPIDARRAEETFARQKLREYDFVRDRNQYPKGPAAEGRGMFNVTGWEGGYRGSLLLSDEEAEAFRSALAALPKPTDEPAHIRERWNVELDGNDVLICFNDHEKGEKCDYVRFTRALSPAPDTVGVPREAILDLIDRRIEDYTGFTTSPRGVLQSLRKDLEALLASPLQLDEDRSFAASIEAQKLPEGTRVLTKNVLHDRESDSALAGRVVAIKEPYGTKSYLIDVPGRGEYVLFEGDIEGVVTPLSALSKRAGEREGDNAVWNEAVEACASLIEPRNPEHDWTEYGRENARRAARIRQQLMRPSPALKRPDKKETV